MTELSAAGVRDAVLARLKTVLGDTPVQQSPFLHVYFDDVFPDEIYSSMLEQLPDPAVYRPLSINRHQREDGTSTRDIFELEESNLARLAPPRRALWSGVSAALHSAELKQLVFEVLGAGLARRFRVAPGEVGEIEAFPKSALMRDLGGYEISPHPDSPSKIVTMQFYLPESMDQEDMGTALYRLRLLKLKNLVSPKNAFEIVERFPFRPKSGYAFVVTRTSWHGRPTLPLVLVGERTIRATSGFFRTHPQGKVLARSFRKENSDDETRDPRPDFSSIRSDPGLARGHTRPAARREVGFSLLVCPRQQFKLARKGIGGPRGFKGHPVPLLSALPY